MLRTKQPYGRGQQPGEQDWGIGRRMLPNRPAAHGVQEDWGLGRRILPNREPPQIGPQDDWGIGRRVLPDQRQPHASPPPDWGIGNRVIGNRKGAPTPPQQWDPFSKPGIPERQVQGFGGAAPYAQHRTTPEPSADFRRRRGGIQPDTHAPMIDQPGGSPPKHFGSGLSELLSAGVPSEDSQAEARRKAWLAQLDAQVEAKAAQRAAAKAAKTAEEREELLLEAQAGSSTAKAALERMGAPVPPAVVPAMQRVVEPPSVVHHRMAGDYRLPDDQKPPPTAAHAGSPAQTFREASAPPTARLQNQQRGRRRSLGERREAVVERQAAVPPDLVKINKLMDEMMADRHKWEAAFHEQAVRKRSSGVESHHELKSDSKLLYSKWSNAVGSPSAGHMVAGAPLPLKEVVSMDIQNAGIDQLDLLLQQFVRKPLPVLPPTPSYH